MHDDGRGIPVDKEPKTGLPGVEVVFTKLHAGGKFGGGSYVATGGLHGVGASVVNALSARLDVDVDRSPSQPGHELPARRARASSTATGPDAPFTPKSGLTRKGGRVAKGRTGTRIRFWPDRQIFTKDATLRVRRAARPGPADVVHRPGPRAGRSATCAATSPVEEKFRHDGGIAEFAEFLAHDEPVTDILRLQGTDTFTETVPMLDDQGHMTPQEVERELGVDVALRWGTGYDTELRSFVNVIATPKGGTHVSRLRAARHQDVQRRDAGRPRLLKVDDADVIKDDVLEGLTAVVTVRLAEPQFEGQTKEILGTPAARGVVRKVVAARAEGVPDLDQARPRRPRPSWSWRRSSAASRTRLAARQHRETQRRKNALESSALPAKLADCRGHRRRPHRAVHRRGRLGARHRQAGPQLRVPGAAADPRQDPQRPEGLGRRHAQERRVRLDHPGRRRRLGPHVRPRRRAATAGSSSWPTPTPTAPTSAACWRRCSSSTCPS